MMENANGTTEASLVAKGHMAHTELENETRQPLPTPNIALVD